MFLLSLDWDDENEIYGSGSDDDDEISGRGQNESGDSFEFQDTGSNESLLSRDQTQHKPTGKKRDGHLIKKYSGTAEFGGGAGILLLLMVTVFVLSVVSIVFQSR